MCKNSSGLIFRPWSAVSDRNLGTSCHGDGFECRTDEIPFDTASRFLLRKQENADDKNNVTVAKEPGTALGTPGAQKNETGANNDVTGSLATEVKIGRQGQPTSENGDGSGVAEGEGLPSSEKVENAEKVVLEIPPEVKSLMNEGNELYKMGHHSEALVKYTKCVKHLWEGRAPSVIHILLIYARGCHRKL